MSPEWLVRKWYSNVFHRPIDLENPRNLDEKVNWMKLHADQTLWTRCSDKAGVREYVSECGLGDTLNEVYGVWENPSDIDFDALPERFVLKTTNGGGGNNVIIVRDRSSFDPAAARESLARWLSEPVGDLYYEPHYKGIRPAVMAEKYLEQDNGDISLVDIKINCFDGKAHSVFLCSDRDPGKKVCYSVYDLDWNLHPEHIQPYYRTEKVYPRPKSFDDMIRFSEILSKGIPYVRVDWYDIDGKAVFSEMTFTPGGGFQGFYTLDWLEELGTQMKIEK